MQRAVGVDTMMVGALQGLVVLFVAVGLAFRYRPRVITASAPQTPAVGIIPANSKVPE